MISRYEMEKARKATTNEIRNWIWMAVSAGQPIPGSLDVETLRAVLIERGEDPHGYHNT